MRRLPFVSIVALMMSSASLPAFAAELPVARAAGGAFAVKVTSIKEARFRKVIKQQFDFSCGSAALATLLTYHYERPVGEQAIFVAMFEGGDKDKIQKDGFSLLDMKTYLAKHGLEANGFRTDLNRLAEAGIPAVVLINTRGYHHFVVVKGVNDEEVLVGDPALGVKIYRRGEFEKIWNGILFVVTGERDTAQQYFNDEKDWQVRQKAPFGTALNREGLASFYISLRGANEF